MYPNVPESSTSLVTILRTFIWIYYNTSPLRNINQSTTYLGWQEIMRKEHEAYRWCTIIGFTVFSCQCNVLFILGNMSLYPRSLKISGLLCFWLRRRLRLRLRRRRRRTPTLVQAITLSQIHQCGLWRPFCIKKRVASLNCVINSPINYIFGIAIDNTSWKNPIVFGESGLPKWPPAAILKKN